MFQDVATVARTTLTPAEMTLTYELGLQPINGPGGAATYQNITGWARTMVNPTITMKIPWVTTLETFWDQTNSSLTRKQLLFQSCPTDGLTVGFYAPRVYPIGNRPSGVTEVNEQNYVEFTVACDEGPTTTNELTRSSLRFFSM